MKKAITITVLTAFLVVACKKVEAPVPAPTKPAAPVVSTQPPVPPVVATKNPCSPEGKEWALGTGAGIKCFKCVSGVTTEGQCPPPAPPPAKTVPPVSPTSSKPSPKPCKEGQVSVVGGAGGAHCEQCVGGKMIVVPCS